MSKDIIKAPSSISGKKNNFKNFTHLILDRVRTRVLLLAEHELLLLLPQRPNSLFKFEVLENLFPRPLLRSRLFCAAAVFLFLLLFLQFNFELFKTDESKRYAIKIFPLSLYARQSKRY